MENTFFNSTDLNGEEHTLEQQWIADVRKGDKGAFRKIFEKYYEPLRGFACRYTKAPADADGAVQDVFLWIWEKKESWVVEGRLKTYLFRAVKHQCLDIIRKQQTEEKYLDTFTREQKATLVLYEPDDTFDNEKFEKNARAAIEELPEKAKQIYKLSRVDGLTYQEIAAVLDISPKTVESQISRALHILRFRLSKYLMLLMALKKAADSLF